MPITDKNTSSEQTIPVCILIPGILPNYASNVSTPELKNTYPIPRIASPSMLKAMAGVMGIVEKIVPVPDTYSSEYLRVNAGVTYIGNNAKARRELGYEPRDLKEGLTQTLHHEMLLLGMK